MPCFPMSAVWLAESWASWAMDTRSLFVWASTSTKRLVQYSKLFAISGGTYCCIGSDETWLSIGPNSSLILSSTTSSQKKSNSSSLSSHAPCHDCDASSACTRWSFNARTKSTKAGEDIPPRPPLVTSCNIDEVMDVSAVRSARQDVSVGIKLVFSWTSIWISVIDIPLSRSSGINAGSCGISGWVTVCSGAASSTGSGATSSESSGALVCFSTCSTSSCSSSSTNPAPNKLEHPWASISFAHSTNVLPATSICESIPAFKSCDNRFTSSDPMARKASAVKACLIPSCFRGAIVTGDFLLILFLPQGDFSTIVVGSSSFGDAPKPNHPRFGCSSITAISNSFSTASTSSPSIISIVAPNANSQALISWYFR